VRPQALDNFMSCRVIWLLAQAPFSALNFKGAMDVYVATEITNL
jgi:hypothetical protein